MEISKDILDKYGLPTIEQYRQNMQEGESEALYYRQFLSATDHIPNKIVEAQIAGREPTDYTEILNYRQLARDEINKL